MIVAFIQSEWLILWLSIVVSLPLVNWWFANDLVRLSREKRTDKDDPKTKVSYCEETGMCALDIDRWACLHTGECKD